MRTIIFILVLFYCTLDICVSTTTTTPSDETSTITTSDDTSTITTSDDTSTITTSDETSTRTTSDDTSTITTSDDTSTITTSDDTSTITTSDETSTITSDDTSIITTSDETSTITPDDTSTITSDETSMVTDETSMVTSDERSMVTDETSMVTTDDVATTTLDVNSSVTSNDVSATTLDVNASVTSDEVSTDKTSLESTTVETSYSSQDSTYSTVESDLVTTLSPTLIKVELDGHIAATDDRYLGANVNAVICCMFWTNSLRDLTITWLKGGASIPDTDRRRISTEWIYGTYGSTLTITTLYRRDAGNYTCHANEGSVNKSQTIYLPVYEEPEVMLSPSLITLRPGQTSNFTCTILNRDFVEGELGSLTWCKGGVNITESLSSRIYRVEAGVETVEVEMNDDSADFSCGVDNCTASAALEILSNTDKYCAADTDERGTAWPDTATDNLLVLPCPPGYQGTTTRRCQQTGEWEDPNYISCVQDGIKDAEERLKIIQESPGLVGEIGDVLTALSGVTGMTSLSAGDLDATVDTVEQIANIVTADTTFNADRTTVEAFVSIVDNILSVSPSGQWKQVLATNPVKVSTLMASTTSVGLSAARSIQTENTTLEITDDNVVLQLGNLWRSDITHPASTIAGIADSLTLPASNFNNNDKVTYVAVIYKTLADFLLDAPIPDVTSSKEVNSHILSLAVRVDDKDFIRLYDNITMDFENLQTNYSQPECSYWDFNGGNWKTDGCTAKEITASLTQCTCNHLTNFAILMKPGRPESEPQRYLSSEDIIAVVGCSVALLGCLITLVTHHQLWRHIKSSYSVLSIQFSLCVTCVFLVFLVAIIDDVTLSNNKSQCVAIAAFLQYFFMTSFFLLLAQGVEIVTRMSESCIVVSRLFFLTPLAWGLPGIIIGTTLGAKQLDGFGHDKFCWVAVANDVFYAFVGPVLLVLLLVVVVTFMILKSLTTSDIDEDKTKNVKDGVRNICVMSILLAATWIDGVMHVNGESIIYTYLFALFSSLVGIFIVLLLVLFSKVMNKGMKEYRNKRKFQTYSLSSFPEGYLEAVTDQKKSFKMKELRVDYSMSDDSSSTSSKEEPTEVINHRVNESFDKLVARVSTNSARADALNKRYSVPPATSSGHDIPPSQARYSAPLGQDAVYATPARRDSRPPARRESKVSGTDSAGFAVRQPSWQLNVPDTGAQRLPRVSINDDVSQSMKRSSRSDDTSLNKHWSSWSPKLLQGNDSYRLPAYEYQPDVRYPPDARYNDHKTHL